jgi:hypothetical protein
MIIFRCGIDCKWTSVKWQYTYKEHKIEQAEQVLGHRSTTVVRHFLVSASCVQSVVVLHENFKACKIKWICILFPMAQQPLVGQGVLAIEASRSHSDTPLLVGLLWTSDQPDAQTPTRQHTTLTRDRHPYQWMWFSILHLLGDQTRMINRHKLRGVAFREIVVSRDGDVMPSRIVRNLQTFWRTLPSP